MMSSGHRIQGMCARKHIPNIHRERHTWGEFESLKFKEEYWRSKWNQKHIAMSVNWLCFWHLCIINFDFRKKNELVPLMWGSAFHELWSPWRAVVLLNTIFWNITKAVGITNWVVTAYFVSDHIMHGRRVNYCGVMITESNAKSRRMWSYFISSMMMSG